jgi:hypothetical protein
MGVHGPHLVVFNEHGYCLMRMDKSYLDPIPFRAKRKDVLDADLDKTQFYIIFDSDRPECLWTPISEPTTSSVSVSVSPATPATPVPCTLSEPAK